MAQKSFNQRIPSFKWVALFAIIITLGLTVFSVQKVSTNTQQHAATLAAASCNGPFLRVWDNYNYKGKTKDFCAVYVIYSPAHWYLNNSYVGDEWNDIIKSYKLYNWPQGYAISFYKNGGYDRFLYTTTINHNPETNSNTCQFGSTGCEISSFKITSYPH